MALTTAQIQQAYVTFFNRPADTAGLTYWSGYAGSVADLYNTFAQQSEYTTAYSGLTTSAIVNLVYSNLFGRAPDAAGLAYWSTQIDAGKISVAQVANTIGFGAQSTDATIIANKVAAAGSFTNALDTAAKQAAYAVTGAAGLKAVKEWLATVSSGSATVTTAVSNIPTVLTTVQANQGSTFTLTSAVETKVLTSGNDTVDGTATDSVAGDNIVDSSTGDNDTLNAVVTSNITNSTSITNIENVNFTDTFGGKTISLEKVSGAKVVTVASQYGLTSTLDEINGSNVAKVAVGDKVVTLNANNISNGATIAVSAKQTTLALDGKTADTDAVTVNLAGGSLSVTAGTDDIKTLNLVSQTAANTVTLATSVLDNAAASIAVSGDKDLTLKANASDIGTNIGLGVSKSMTGGAKLTVDLLSTAAAADLTKVAADAWTVNATSSALGTNSLTFAAGTTVLTLNANVVDNAGGFTATGSATTDTLNVTLNKAQTNFVSSGYETVNLTNATGSNLSLTNLVAGSGTSGGTVKFLGDKDVTVATSIAAKAVDASGLTGTAKLTLTTGSANSAATSITGTANNDTVTASGASSNLTITTGDGNDTVVSGSGNDTINAGAGNDTITLTAGDNFVLAGEGENIISVSTTGADTIVLGNGNNSVTFAAASGWSATDNLYGGTGTDTLTLAGAGGYGTLSLTDNFTGFDKIDITAGQTAATSITLADGNTSGAFTFQTLATSANTAAITFDAKADTDTKFTVTGGSGTSGATIKTGALADTITWTTADTGAVGITAGKGVDTIALTQSSTAAVVTLTQAKGDSGTLTAVTNAMSTAGFDVVTGLGVSDKIDTGNANITAVTLNDGSTNPASLVDNGVYFLEGVYNSTTKTFTVGGTANATLVVYDADSSAATQFEAIVLAGLSTLGTNTVSAGVLTLV